MSEEKSVRQLERELKAARIREGTEAKKMANAVSATHSAGIRAIAFRGSKQASIAVSAREWDTEDTCWG